MKIVKTVEFTSATAVPFNGTLADSIPRHSAAVSSPARTGQNITMNHQPLIQTQENSLVRENSKIVATEAPNPPRKHPWLLPPWKPGQSGNPLGEQRAGALIEQHYNVLAGRSEYEYVAIARDKTVSGARRAAAKSWLRTLRDDFHNATPLAANDLDRIMDRTVGKPTQRVEVAERRRSPAEILGQLSALLAVAPRSVCDDIARALPTGWMDVQPIGPGPGTGPDGLENAVRRGGGTPMAAGSGGKPSLSFVQPISKVGPIVAGGGPIVASGVPIAAASGGPIVAGGPTVSGGGPTAAAGGGGDVLEVVVSSARVRPKTGGKARLVMGRATRPVMVIADGV